MMLSEDAARGRWCPFARVSTMTGQAINRDAGGSANPSYAGCVGSACMAWRWAGWWMKDFHTVSPEAAIPQREGDRLGYCSLAGRPSPPLDGSGTG